MNFVRASLPPRLSLIENQNIIKMSRAQIRLDTHIHGRDKRP
jgi:hypothetical protein